MLLCREGKCILVQFTGRATLNIAHAHKGVRTGRSVVGKRVNNNRLRGSKHRHGRDVGHGSTCSLGQKLDLSLLMSQRIDVLGRVDLPHTTTSHHKAVVLDDVVNKCTEHLERVRVAV